MALGFDEIGQLSPWVDFLSTNRFTPEIARALLARSKPYGIYNGAGDSPAGARLFFGFYGWKTGAAGIAQWAYNFGSKGIFQGGGMRSEDDGYVYYGPDGPLPSIMWEAVREGIKDYRATDALWRMIQAAERLEKPAARAAANRARRALNDVLRQIGWDVQAMTSGDRAAPPHPSSLRKWRLAVLREILALQSSVPSLPPPTSPARSPFDHPWAQPAASREQAGPEVFPGSGFETALDPWRIEAWKGAGSGALDRAEAHGGGQSLRLDIPADAGSEAITVLVWPSWGGGKITFDLGADRTYEFSAWVKLQDRQAPPDLRCSVPQATVRATRTGREAPDARGWQRLWLRLEMRASATPTYLAVWLQGPGTAWVDDLQMREVLPPPLQVRCDQATYDSADAIGVISMTTAPHLPGVPHALQVRLTRADGTEVARVAAPFQSATPVATTATPPRLTLLAPVSLRGCECRFSPAMLPPGDYSVKAALLDAQGQPLADDSAPFRRLPDDFG
jgi:hypothetical protein